MGKNRDQLLCELDRVAGRKELLPRGTDEWRRLQNLQVRILGELQAIERSAETSEAPTYSADGVLTYRAKPLPLRVVA